MDWKTMIDLVVELIFAVAVCHVCSGVWFRTLATCERRHATTDLAPELLTKRVRWVFDGCVICLLAVVPVAVPPSQLNRLPFVCQVPPSAVAGMQPLCKAIMASAWVRSCQRCCAYRPQQICAQQRHQPRSAPRTCDAPMMPPAK